MLSHEDKVAVSKAIAHAIDADCWSCEDAPFAVVERIASDAARAAERALVERIEANSERPEPEAMSNAEGEAWDLLHDDSNIICTCDGCNFYSPTYDDRAECSLNIYIEDIVLARVRFATRAALRPEAATTERHWDECLHGVTLGSVCLDCPSKWASIPARPAATTEGAVCKHCGRRIENNMHAEGRQRGLGRCDTADSGLPYGYEAEGAGEPCSIACRGSSKLAEGDAAAVHPDTEGAVEQEGAHFACCDLPDGGCGGCGNCPEHCVCDRPCGYCIAARAARGEGEPT